MLLNNLLMSKFYTVYRKTGTRDPSGTLQKPEKHDDSGTLHNLKTGTLTRLYKNRKTGTLAGP